MTSKMTQSELGITQKTGDSEKPIPSPLLFFNFNTVQCVILENWGYL